VWKDEGIDRKDEGIDRKDEGGNGMDSLPQSTESLPNPTTADPQEERKVTKKQVRQTEVEKLQSGAEGLKKPRLVKSESSKATKERVGKAFEDLKRGQKEKAPKAGEDVKKGTKEKAPNPKALKDTTEKGDKDARQGRKGGSSNSQVPGWQETSKGKPHRVDDSGKGIGTSANSNLPVSLPEVRAAVVATTIDAGDGVMIDSHGMSASCAGPIQKRKSRAADGLRRGRGKQAGCRRPSHESCVALQDY
jgi:hypothetical protein